VIESTTAVAIYELITFPIDEFEGTTSAVIFREITPGARGQLRFYAVNRVVALLYPVVHEGSPGHREWIVNDSTDLGLLFSRGLVRAISMSDQQKKLFPDSDAWFQLTDVGRRVARLTAAGLYMPTYLVRLGLRDMAIADVRDYGPGVSLTPPHTS
jgi:hypothetical protein